MSIVQARALLDEAVTLAGEFTLEERAARVLQSEGWPTDRDALDGALSGGRLVHLAVSQARAGCQDGSDVDDSRVPGYAARIVTEARRAATGEASTAAATHYRMDAASATGARAAADAVADLLEVLR